MMDCEQTRELLSGYVDDALEAADRLAIERHLDACAACSEERDRLAALDAALQRIFQEERRRGAAVGQAVMSQVAGTARHADSPQSGTVRRRMAGYLLAAAAGFLVAVLIDPPWREPVAGNANVVRQNGRSAGPSTEATNRSIESPDRVSPAARIVHAVGSVAVRHKDMADWRLLAQEQLRDYACPADSRVRTPAGSLCEVTTASGGRVCLNELTEVAFRSGTDVEFSGGELWCRAPAGGRLNVRASGEVSDGGAAAESSTARLWTFTCPSDASCVATAPADQPPTIVAATGAVEVSVNGTIHRLTAGSSCRLVDGEVSVDRSPDARLVAERWLQPLLALHGYDHPELNRRVDGLLSAIGNAKLSLLFERDLRALGEYGAVPLLRFVQSQQGRDEPSKRHTAVGILKDVAPVWMLPDLIALLEDGDPVVRSAAAEALERLTGETHGLDVRDWQADRARWAGGVAAWKQWWMQHRLSCTPPPPNVGPISPRTELSPPTPEPRWKARNN